MSNKYDFKRFSIGHGPDCGWIYDNTQKTEVAQVVDKSCWPLIEDANAAEELRAQLAAAQKRIAELEQEHGTPAVLPDPSGTTWARLNYWKDEDDKAQQRIAELEEALRPFAAASKVINFTGLMRETGVIWARRSNVPTDPTVEISIKDLDKAAAVIAEPSA